MRRCLLLVRGSGRALAVMTALSALACAGSQQPDKRTAQRPAPDSPGPPPPAAGTTVYACTDGVRFSVRSIDGSRVVLALPERLDTLGHVEAASGARYAGESVVFWSKGQEASLEGAGARHTGCRDRRAGDPWEEAALMGVGFRAVGQEPGWALDLVEGGWVRYVGDYGATRIYAPAVKPVRGANPGTAVYDAESKGRNLRVELRETPCRDAMSGESFTHAVTVRLDGRVVEGCGRMTHPGELTNKYWKLSDRAVAPGAALPADPRERRSCRGGRRPAHALL